LKTKVLYVLLLVLCIYFVHAQLPYVQHYYYRIVARQEAIAAAVCLTVATATYYFLLKKRTIADHVAFCLIVILSAFMLLDGLDRALNR